MSTYLKMTEADKLYVENAGRIYAALISREELNITAKERLERALSLADEFHEKIMLGVCPDEEREE